MTTDYSYPAFVSTYLTAVISTTVYLFVLILRVMLQSGCKMNFFPAKK